MNPASENNHGLQRGFWSALRRGLPRLFLFALLWWVLTEGDMSSWLVGAPAVLAATVAAVALQPARPRGWSVIGLFRFVPFFLWRSLAGGIDVGFRALDPRLPISPSLEKYPLRLPRDGLARVFFANTLNLLPGTLSAELEDDTVTIHVLRGGPAVLRHLRELEEVVAALFGQKLPETPPPEWRSHD